MHGPVLALVVGALDHQRLAVLADGDDAGDVALEGALGPFTAMCAPEIVTSTPLGTGIGDLPMRDMSDHHHEAEDLAADLALARLPVGQQSLAGREHRHAQPAEDAGTSVDLE